MPATREHRERGASSVPHRLKEGERIALPRRRVVLGAVALSAAGLIWAPAASAAERTVATMFGPVAVPDALQRVIALGWADAEIALALGVKPIAVADWESFGGKGVGGWASPLFGEQQPVLLPGGEIALERLVALNPDLILNTRSDGSAETFARLSQVAPTVYAAAPVPAFAGSWQDQVRQVAAALGKASEGSDLIGGTENEIVKARAAHPEFAGKTAVVASTFGGQYGASIPGDVRVDLLTALGFVPSPAFADLPASGFYVTISPERADLLNSDVLLMLPLSTTVAEMQQDALLSRLPVVSSGHAIFLEPNSELAQAFSSGSPLAIRFSLATLVPQLAAALRK